VDPDGNELDKNTNPFGTNTKKLAKELSLVAAGQMNYYTGSKNDNKLRFGIYKIRPVEEDLKHSFNGFTGVPTTPLYENINLLRGPGMKNEDICGKISQYLSNKRKVMAAGDMNGDAFEEIITAVIEKTEDKDEYQLKLVVVDGHDNDKITQQVLSLPIPSFKWSELGFIDPCEGLARAEQNNKESLEGRSMQFKKHFRIAACKGKVAILLNRTVYDFSLTLKDENYTAVKNRECTFNENSILSPIANTEVPAIDIKAEDVNEDGLSDLMITTGSDKGTKDSNLLIYSWEDALEASTPTLANKDFNHPLTVLKLYDKIGNGGDGSRLKFAGITVGNVTGKGWVVVVGGHTADSKIAFLTFRYDAETDKFKYEDYSIQQVDESSIENQLPELVCTSLSKPKAGSPEVIVYNSKIYKYNQEKKKILLVKDFTKDQGFHQKFTSDHVIYDTIAGKFNGDRAQVFMLYQGIKNGYGTILIYEDDKGEIKVKFTYYNKQLLWYQNESWEMSMDGYSYYPAYCATTFKDKTLTLKFKDAFFAMSDPKVIAVLSAPPYYKELESEYGGGLGNAVTTFGTSKTRENGSSGTFSVTAQTVVGFETEVSAGLIENVKIASFEATVTATSEFTTGWGESNAYTTSQSFSAVGKDMVVMTSVPYDVYQFEIINPGEPNDGATIQICIPYQPQLSPMNLEDYNKMIDKVNSQNAFPFLTRVPENILNHNVGDPRTYGSRITPGIGASDIIAGASFLGVGTGDGVSSQTISVSHTNSRSFETSIGLDVGFRSTFFGVITGGSVGGKWGEMIDASLTTTQDISGSVASLPPSRDNFYFQWELVGFKCPLSSEESCYVVNYLIKPMAIVPPAPPTNVTMLKYNNTAVTLGWDRVEKARKYLIYRSTTKDVSTKIPYATLEATTENPVFTDTKLIPRKTYYYSISSVGDTAGKQGEALAIPIQMTELSIKKQPRLEYNAGDLMDLTGMVLEMTGSDGSTLEIAFKDFYRRGIILNVKNQTALTKDDDELSIIITDPLTGLIGITDPIAVKARVSDTTASNGATSSVEKTELIPLDVKTSFTVGGTQGASALMSSSFIEANTTIQNKQKITRPVIVVMAEYNVNGAMIHMDYSAKVISAGATETIRVGGFQLPYNINGHVVKVFVIDGEDFDSSSLIPISAIEQIQ